MTEQELLDIFIQERINILLAKFNKSKPDKLSEERANILQVEKFIESLPEKEKKLVQDYIEHFIDGVALEEPFLYQQRVMDNSNNEFLKNNLKGKVL